MTKREKLAYLRGYMNGLYMMSRFRLETCPDNREKAAKNIWDHYFRELYKALGLPPGTVASSILKLYRLTYVAMRPVAI